ncbi:hypothetical protein PHYSODRAFT_298747 [Phytophthora sojae]|uniref:Uncharacterized protein n=1 Tax=Phytophthora sojae (strain P6497) TaxID=1094619 RepID=G4Z391_PHYSP|nr:hypothetical protein PHYSODRAFT_298747 [Phytophthora sojae]EGZ20760.1 hypothetical protein PHYSODRAFT_298747 [Phytophthora sojae]|eukprot:XP_009523477.1 hypothetical protein PHYSODRAFT_298747 [Phytophthora sojae]
MPSKKQRLTSPDVDTPAPLIAPHRPHSSPGSIGRLTQPESNEPASAVCAASRRPQLAPSEKVAVLNWYHANGRNQKATAAHFRALSRYAKLNQGTISRWLAAEAKIREAQSKSVASDAVHNCRRNARRV